MNTTPITSPFSIAIDRVTLLVGFTALALPLVLLATSRAGLSCEFDSLSHYYYSRFGADWFVGSLCFIGLLMMFLYVIRPGEPGFEGFRKYDPWIMRGAGLAAFLIAFFPTAGTGCDDMAGQIVRVFVQLPPGAETVLPKQPPQPASLADLAALTQDPEQARITFGFFSLLGLDPGLDGLLHNVGTVAMFSALGYFSLFVFTRRQDMAALRPGASVAGAEDGALQAFRSFNSRKKVRNAIYVAAGVTIFACIFALIVQNLAFGCKATPVGDLCRRWNSVDATLKVEWIALWAFAASWLVKGRVIPWLRDP